MFVSGTSLTPIDFAGLRILDYTAGHDLSASVAVIDVPAGGRHAEAWSKRSDKYYLVIAGAIQFVLDGIERELSTGDFCWVPQGSRFRYSNPGITLAKLVLVHAPNFELAQEVFVESPR